MIFKGNYGFIYIPDNRLWKVKYNEDGGMFSVVVVEIENGETFVLNRLDDRFMAIEDVDRIYNLVKKARERNIK